MIQEGDIALNPDALRGFYESYFQYYTTLTPQYKNRFITRCLHFIESKKIIGAEGFNVTNKVRAIISASAIQLTLGLETWDYDYFMHIIIHPQKFLDKATQQQFKGETNLRGYIQFSWLSFINGYKNPNDNVNLGIHEFSHALRFNSFRGNAQDYYTKHFFIMWLSTAYEVHHQMKKGKQTIFREYGGTNINEFISVCFEHYFESPQQIKEAYPLLYLNTAILLNQKTENSHTHIDIREQIMFEKRKLLTPLKNREIKQKFVDSNALPLISISAVILGFTMMAAGIFSGPSLILLLVFFAGYLKLDANYITLVTNKNELEIKKGYFILKNWYRHSFQFSHLVNVTLYKAVHDCEFSITYFNSKDDHFYEENFRCEHDQIEDLLAEFKNNKIAINRL